MPITGTGPFMGDIATRVRRARMQAGLSQIELASAAGVKRSAVAQWEQTDGTNPTPDHLTKIACATGFQFEWLATGRGPASMSAVENDVVVFDIARTELESRMLDAMKRLPKAKQELALKMVNVLADT